jgi:protein-tyrosine phosphatase
MDEFRMGTTLGSSRQRTPQSSGAAEGFRRVLFLCTGNYYRSRFAEELFNHLARDLGLSWRAESAGLAIERLEAGAGMLSVHAVTRLKALNLPADPVRGPRSCRDSMILAADRVIALHEVEHRELVEQRHSRVAARVEYWHVPDLDGAQPPDALDAIERLVRGLADDLHGRGAGAG